MLTVAAKRTIGAGPGAVWDVVGDPHHLPRWWPRVVRVEGVDERGFTQVLAGKRGKLVRADFDVLEADAERRVVWEQHLAGTPFEAVLGSAVTAIEIAPAAGGAATDVRIELRQELTGADGGGLRMLSLRPFGGSLVKRAAARTLEQALAGLERVFGT
ncbi:MAG TPA: SRPBCC family protein [Solirubrobacteraceae bacterium]|nr:SRPBCC family protein [Solirubrobacteraceae bacterium]